MNTTRGKKTTNMTGIVGKIISHEKTSHHKTSAGGNTANTDWCCSSIMPAGHQHLL